MLSDSICQFVMLSDSLLTSALKLFSQISVTADNNWSHKNTLLNKMTVSGMACCYLFPFVPAQLNTKSI